MEKDLEKYLKILNSERCLKKPKEGIIIIEKITNCFTHDSSQFTIGLLINLVLNENDGIFTFIWKMAANSETLLCVSAAFKFLDSLINNFQKYTEPYFSILYEKCLYLLDGKFAKVKEVSLKLIKNIIEADGKHTLDLSKLVLKLEKILKVELKIPGTVIDQIYNLLGYLFKKYPECIKNEKLFLNKMLESLREESGAKNPSLSKIKGAFEGINGYLTNHSPTDADILKQVYDYIKIWSKYREDKKPVSKACLSLLQNHWRHFPYFMYRDQEFWRVNLDVWISQKTADREIAFKCLCSFYSVIALFVKQQSNVSEVRNYVKEFTGCLDSGRNTHERKAALVGIKLFILTGSLPVDDFNETFDFVVNFIKKEEKSKNFTYMPLCIECVSGFVLKSDNDVFYTEQLSLLQRLSVKLIENYPSFEEEFQPNAVIALEKSFYMLGLSSVDITDNHIETVVYQGLVRTCSSMTSAELELLIETNQNSGSVCYKSYLNLWKYLLTMASSSVLPVGGSFLVKKKVAAKVFDAFVVSFLKVLSKLNFKIDANWMEVEKPSDLNIFINMVDLYQELIPFIDLFNLEKWLCEIFRTVIELSRKNPLVTGFYTIAASNLRVADRIHFFEERTNDKCFESVGRYLEDILGKIDHWKGDLQVSCLKVLLSAPVVLVKDLVEKAIPALQVTTQLSRSCFPLLKDLIEALERWDLDLPSETSEVIMREVLPHLDVFFQSPYFRGKNSVDSSNGGKKLKVEVVFNDSELLILQKRFLMFLGNLEMRKGLSLIERTDAEAKWKISDKPLLYSLPCGKGWVELNLDEMVLRVVELTRSCADRRIRITACELLYSLVMIVVGNINQYSGGYTCLFRKVVKASLTLGCDSDGVICQIFEPLMYQLVHYFSGKQAFHFPETNDLIDILTESATSPFNPTVRDFSSELLREFTVWSIKQLSPEEVKATPECVKRILQRIYSLALHPSYNKRLGAAVIFNKIYSVLREEDFVLNAYWFQLFYYFMESLRMCEEDEDITEITEAIGHVKRPLVEGRKEFNKDSNDRVIPPEFKGRRLCHLVKWTMERACDVKPKTRRIAMSLVEELAPLVENCDSNMSFASKQLQNFFQINGNFGENFNEWLRYQTAGFEYCTWLLKRNVLTVDEVFQPKFKAVMKKFMNEILSESNEGQKEQAVLAFLPLLEALKERVCLYPPEHWEFLKTTVFQPRKFGFESTETLFHILTKLLRHFSNHLTEYDWENFYRDLESLVTVPMFGHITRKKHVSTECLEFLFAVKVIETSGFWKVFMKKVFFSVREDIFVELIFKSLFCKRGTSVYAVTLEPSCKLYLEEVLKVFLKVSEDLNGVMKCLENEEEVLEEETEKSVKKGEYFQMVFKDTIFNFLESKHQSLINWAVGKSNFSGVRLLIQILENRSGGADLPLDVFVRWKDFENISTDCSKNKILLRLAVAAARVVGTPGFLKTSPVADRIYEIFENQKFQDMEFSEIESVVTLLPFLSVFGERMGENEKLANSLCKIQVDENALKESGKGCKQNHVTYALIGLLQSLKTTGSLVVFDFILKKVMWFNVGCKKEDIESGLEVFGDSRTPLEHSSAALKLVYHYCFHDDADFSSLLIYKLFLNPLLKLAPNPSVYHVVNDNLENLSQLMSNYWGEDKTPLEILTDMAKKISAAGVLETLVTKLPKEELEQMPKGRRQMIDGIVKSVFFFLKKPYPPRVLKERYRKLMCGIFNMICCIVSARCVDEKFYKLFIFDHRGSFLFEAIDKNASYNLDMDFEEIPKRKKHLTILRETITEENQNPVKYIQTNTLFTSSLREEVTWFDLTSSFVRPVSSVPQRRKNVEIELEMDSLNSHECMATLVATISKMVRDKITPLDDVTELPCWLRFFMSVLKNSDLCENLRLFVLKAIYNVQEFVALFSKLIFSDFLDAILKLFVNYPINYFLMDLIEMMVRWRYVPEEERARLQVTELVEIVLQKSDSLRLDIVKYNLEILKLMVEVWKNGMYLPQLSQTVFKRLFRSVGEDLKSGTNADSVTYLNVHTCGILLSNGIPAWKEGSEKEFFDLILKGFREEYKYNQIFGEVCGQALSHLQKTNPKLVQKYEEMVRDKISGGGTWLQVLYGVHKHHPKMSSMFTFRIFSSAWDSMDSLTVKKLEMLLSHVSDPEAEEDSTFDRHVGAFLIDMLSSPDVSVQEYSLRIADKVLDKLEGDKLKVITKEVVRLQRSGNSLVRKWVYEIGKKLHGKGEEILEDVKIVMLRGLNDGVKELEEFCLAFWRETLNFSSPELTLVEILKETYNSEAEDVFLTNAARILLQLGQEDYQTKKEIFPHPIVPRSKFLKRNLVLGTRQSSFLSLASSINRTLRNESIENVATIRRQNLHYLRSTVRNFKFQPTVQEKPTEVPIQTQQNTPIPKNPYKRRFYKTDSKGIKWQKQKKQDNQKKDTDVEILSEYRDGDYPDIQITHSQVKKLLEGLSKRDQQFARLLLVSFYSGVIKTVTGKQRDTFLADTSTCFEKVLKSSGNFDPGVFGFVLQVILNNCRNLNIDYQLISNAALSSNWISLGALILEELINEEDLESVAPKKRKGCPQPEEKKWLELARLYRSLEECDVLSGIFLDKLNVTGDAREAIRCESLWDWAGASKYYESTLRSDPDFSQVEFYTESYLSCLAKLSNWSALNTCIRTTVNNDLGELWNNYYLLSWFLKSEMMISLGKDRKEFQEVLEEFCKNSGKRDVLAANFGEEMTVFDWFSGNLQRANYRIDKICVDFLAGWSHLDQWCYNLRAAKLGSLQTLSELSFAVKNLSEVSKSQLEENIQLGMRRWEKNSPTARDELTIWDVKLGYRREFLKRLEGFDLTKLDVKANLALANAALCQENLNLTKECLSRAKEKLPEGDFDLRAEHNRCFNMGKMVVAKLKMKDPNVGLEVYLNVWNGISKQLSSTMDTESSKTIAYTANFTLGQLVSEILPFVKTTNVSQKVLEAICCKLNSAEDNVGNALQEKGLEYFETAINALNDVNCTTETKSLTYLELCQFLFKYPEPKNFEKLCEYLLKAMGLGNREARQLFGCLLNLSCPDDTSLDKILTECERVPTWMFLVWINQILARVNSSLFPLLRSILLRIAEDYPNSLRYAVKVMEEVKPETKSFFVRLCQILWKDDVYNNFWISMKYLAPPDLILCHYLEDVLEDIDQSEPDYSEAKRKLYNLQKLMYAEEYAKFRGPIFKFWENFKEPLEDLLSGFDDVEVLRRRIKNMLSSVQNAKMPSKKTLALLESYSPWLYEFHALKGDATLELPGQYDSDRQPIKKYLVTVSSFRNEVMLYDSKCRPMRISILGNDAKEHKFLVKFGEDLRQDERIQQVFEHFNQRLRENKQRRYWVDTYKVVPLTSNLGMIEWVEDHVSLYEMIENCLGNDSDAIVKAQTSHLEFLSQGSPLAVPGSVRGTVAAHLIAYELVKRENAISNFKATAQRFRKDLLKKSFMDLSTSPEHFMYLRGNFATSHAVTCITHWLIGIGDRHLQNSLISTKTGRVLGIDFGCAFGFATQFLTPPELIPFRLSPQIINFMEPLGESGWIKQTMIHCLRSFRKDRFRLSSVLEVFAEEPVMNWVKQTKKNPNYQAECDTWYPREKIRLVEEKLSGANPVSTIEADLRAGHSGSKYLDLYLGVLRGVQQDNIRARCPEGGLTEEEQVECLIDLATDPHILAKTYIGWNPWL